MLYLRSLVFVVLLACGSRLFASELEKRMVAQSPERLLPSLQGVIDTALEQSVLVEERALAEAEARGVRLGHGAAVLPTVFSSLDYRQEEPFADQAGQSRLIYDLRLSQPVFHWGARRANKQIGDIGLELVQMQTREGMKGMVLSARARYMDLILAKQRLARAEESLAKAERDLETQGEREKQGQVSAVVLEGIRSGILRAEISVDSERLQMDRLAAQFARELRAQPEALTSNLESEIPAFPFLRDWEARGLLSEFDYLVESSSELRRQDQLIEVEKRRLHIFRKTLWPKLNFNVGLSQNELDNQGVRRESEFVFGGLGVNWALFDGHDAKGKSMESLARLRRLEMGRSLAEQRLADEFRFALRSLELTCRSLELDEEALSGAQLAVRSGEEELRDGLIAEARLEQLREQAFNQKIQTQGTRAAYLRQLSQILMDLGLDPQFQGR